MLLRNGRFRLPAQTKVEVELGIDLEIILHVRGIIIRCERPAKLVRHSNPAVNAQKELAYSIRISGGSPYFGTVVADKLSDTLGVEGIAVADAAAGVRLPLFGEVVVVAAPLVAKFQRVMAQNLCERTGIFEICGIHQCPGVAIESLTVLAGSASKRCALSKRAL